MTTYNVHIYREMRLVFGGIEAESPAAAADIAHEKPTSDADDIVDCDGEDFAALVDVQGDEDYSQSVTIDFEPERGRKAAPSLLAALEAVMEYAELGAEHLDAMVDSKNSDLTAGHAWHILREARDVIAAAKSAGIHPAPAIVSDQRPRFEIEHDPGENPDRVYVLVDRKFDVAVIRTAEGIVIDVYPKNGTDLAGTLAVWDEDVAEPAQEQESAEGA